MNRLDALWDLQQLDLESAAKMKELGQAKSQLGETAEMLAVRKAIEQTEDRLHDLQSHLRDLELELDSLDTKIEQAQQSLYSGRVTNPKELTGLQQDIEYLKRRDDSLEDEILEAMASVEETTSALEEMLGRQKGMEAAWAESQQELAERIEELTTRLRELQSQRADLVAEIPREDLRPYEELRQRKGQALSLMQGDHCETCYVSMPSAKQQQLRRRTSLVFCEGCGRILYIP